MRNTKIVDVIKALEDYGIVITIFDPLANPDEVHKEYELTCHAELDSASQYDAIVLGVAHSNFKDLNFNQYQKETSILYDVKGTLLNRVDGKL